MPSPVVPNDFKALISDVTATLCGNFINTLLKLPVLLYQLVNWMLDGSGNPTKAFVNASLPSGSIVMSACLQNEDGSRLLCDGRELAQATYPDLYAAIGLTYGTAGAGNFKIPDYRARFPVGIGTFAGGGSASIGVVGGEDQHTLLAAELPAHDHSDGTHTYLLKPPYVGSVTGSDAVNSGTEQAVGGGDGGQIVSVGGGVAFDLLPPFLPTYFYIST